MAKQDVLVGAHTSIAGGVHKALLRGAEIGCNTVQIFTSNQKQWKGRPITLEETARWKETLKETKLSHIMSHNSYLTNLGSPKEALEIKSLHAFKEEIVRCQQLGLTFLNFHPGAATGDGPEKCLARIVKNLKKCESLCQKGNLRLLLETTAGQGTSVGHTFEQLGYLIQETHATVPIGVCIDTCHIFSAGYDIRTKKAWDHTLSLFEKAVGLKYLCALHLNDSKHPLGAKKDRHASLGKGLIGMPCFEVVMQHPKLAPLPKYLETPNGSVMWEKEIQLLKQFAKR